MYLQNNKKKLFFKIEKTNISRDTLYTFFQFTDKKNKIVNHKKKLKLDSKLSKLLSISKVKKNFNINVNKSWLINLSDKEIPNDVVDIVSLGRGHSLPTKCSKKDILKTLKCVEHFMMYSSLDSKNKDHIREKIVHNLKSSINDNKRLSNCENIMLKKYNTTLEFVNNNKQLLFTTAARA